MNKIDYKKVFKESYTAKVGQPELVHVPPMHYLMLDGHDDPTAVRNQAAIDALFRIANTVKSMLKKGPMGLDFAVMPLEALWMPEASADSTAEQSAGRWRLMIMQPPVVNATLVEQAQRLQCKKKRMPFLQEVRLALWEEGKAVQMLQVGPDPKRDLAIQRLLTFATEQSYRFVGSYHEIYLRNPRRTAREKLRTILRQPVAG